MRVVRDIGWLAVLLGALFAAFVVFWEIRFSDIAREELRNQAAIIENDLWNLDPKGPSKYLQAAALLSDYESISVFAVDDNKPFLEIRGHETGCLETVLLRTGLISKRQLSAAVLHNGAVIGRLQVVRRHETIYLYGYLLFVLGLFFLAAKFFLQTIKAKQTLEIAVGERTAELQKSREALRLVLNTVPQSIFWKDLEGRYLGCNQLFAVAAGFDDPSQIVGKTDFDLPWPRIQAEAYRATDEDVIRNNRPILHLVEQVQQANGRQIWVETSKVPLCDAAGRPFAVLGVYEDITERKRAEDEKAKLADQLQQAQKMEAVGRLAGGVAHDFNNMLHVILGNVALILKETPPDSPVRENLDELRDSALRSAELTRQLLAFARKQPVEPVALDLNVAVAGMLKILKRLIGENIELIWRPKADLWPVKMDPSQLDQILANLCTNSRDAIGGVGKLIIETENCTFREADCAGHPEVEAGDFVRLTVSDNGRGMDAVTLGQIFEPFFTTKGIGSGTGLGLSTVYGIIKQNSGFISVSSEVGKGTTIKLHLPRLRGATIPLPQAVPSPVKPLVHGRETILLVEDEPGALKIGEKMLERLGYAVLSASLPGEAIRMATAHTGKIHLLLTDLVMPEMSGRDLARDLQLVFPEIKCLFMSGYTADVITRDGILDEGVHFIHKPFTQEDLAAKIRETLDEL